MQRHELEPFRNRSITERLKLAARVFLQGTPPHYQWPEEQGGGFVEIPGGVDEPINHQIEAMDWGSSRHHSLQLVERDIPAAIIGVQTGIGVKALQLDKAGVSYPALFHPWLKLVTWTHPDLTDDPKDQRPRYRFWVEYSKKDAGILPTYFQQSYFPDPNYADTERLKIHFRDGIMSRVELEKLSDDNLYTDRLGLFGHTNYKFKYSYNKLSITLGNKPKIQTENRYMQLIHYMGRIESPLRANRLFPPLWILGWGEILVSLVFDAFAGSGDATWLALIFGTPVNLLALNIFHRKNIKSEFTLNPNTANLERNLNRNQSAKLLNMGINNQQSLTPEKYLELLRSILGLIPHS